MPSADSQRSSTTNEPSDEYVPDGLFYKETLDSNAHLACIGKRAVNDALDCPLDVTVGKDQSSIASA